MTDAGTLISGVQQKVDDDSWSSDDILAILNRGVLEVAGGGSRNFGLPLLGPNPDLLKRDSVTALTTTYRVSLPSDYQRGVVRVTDSDGNNITVYKSFKKFFDKYPGMDTTGSISAVCVQGSYLYYQGIPSTSTSLYVWYHRKPTDMDGSTDEPEGIPAHLAYRLLVNYACMEIFSEIEDGIEGAKPNTSYHTNEYGLALTDMHRFIGTADKDPIFVRDDADSIMEDW